MLQSIYTADNDSKDRNHGRHINRSADITYQPSATSHGHASLPTSGIVEHSPTSIHSPLAEYAPLTRHSPRPMQRILVIGSSGAGKSTLARKLGKRLHLPVIHLDRLFWRPGWKKTPEAERAAIVTRLVANEKWIIDGTYRKTLDIRLQAADTIILLDLPRWICVYRATKRRFQYRFRKRQDIADDCDESLFNLSFPRFLRKIWEYPERARPGIIQQLQQLDSSKNIITLKSKAAVRDFCANPAAYLPHSTRHASPYTFNNGRSRVSVF